MGEPLDWDIVDDAMRTIINDELGVREALALAVERCGKRISPADVARIRALDIESDLSHMAQWLGELLRASPPSPDICAFYFGMVELAGPRPSDPGRTDLYVCGCEQFDPDDDGGEWAVDPAWFVDGCYASSAVMAVLGEIDRTSGQHIMLTHAYAASAVRELGTRVGMDAMLVGRESESEEFMPWRGVGVGHDSGGMWTVGVLTPEGWAHPDELEPVDDE